MQIEAIFYRNVELEKYFNLAGRVVRCSNYFMYLCYNILMKKVIRVLSIIFCLVVLLPYLLNLILFTGFSDPFLRLKVFLSQDTLIKQNQCGDGYGWKIVEKDEVKTGNLFELGTKSEVIKWRHLQLSLNDQIVIDEAPYSEKGSYAGEVNLFPAGESFTKMYVFDSNYFSDSPGKYNNIAISINAEEISPQNFDKLATCLQNDRVSIEQSLLGESYERPTQLSWMMRLDNTIRSTLADAPVFSCEDGREISISGGSYLGYNSGSLEGGVGVVKRDGKVYELSPLKPDNEKKTVDLPTTICRNSNGQTLSVYLQSIPERISILK